MNQKRTLGVQNSLIEKVEVDRKSIVELAAAVYFRGLILIVYTDDILFCALLSRTHALQLLMFPNSFCVDRQHKSDREEIKSLKVCSKEYEAMLDEYKNQVDRKILEEIGS